MHYLIMKEKYFYENYKRYTPININYVVVLICLGNPLLKIFIIRSKLSSVSVVYLQILCILFFFNY